MFPLLLVVGQLAYPGAYAPRLAETGAPDPPAVSLPAEVKAQPGRCPHPQKISERSALRILRDLYPCLLPSAEELTRWAFEQATDQQEGVSELEEELADLRRREEAWTEQVEELIGSGVKAPPSL